MCTPHPEQIQNNGRKESSRHILGHPWNEAPIQGSCLGMPIEFLHNRPLEPDELEALRLQIEVQFDRIEAIDPEFGASLNATGLTLWPSCRLKMTTMAPKIDANDGEPWTEMCVRDLKLSLKAGNTIEEAASFLCRSGTADDVRRKADELGLIPKGPAQ
jgi:hypothetical protein